MINIDSIINRIHDLFENSNECITPMGRYLTWTTIREDGIHWISILESNSITVTYGCTSQDAYNQVHTFMCESDELRAKLTEIGL